MAMNFELKARAADPSRLEHVLRQRTSHEPVVLEQEDTFFAVPKGRLKMRCDRAGQCELIYYRRDNDKGPVCSRYFRKHMDDPLKARDELEHLFGVKAVVRKRRKLFCIDETRIHLDEVEGLGNFVEIEVVLKPETNPIVGRHLARQIMQELKIEDRDLLSSAYEDLLVDKKSSEE